MKTKAPGAEMALARRQHPVVTLHEAGFSYRRIATLTGMSKSSCQRTYREVLAVARGVKDIERHRDLVFDDIEASLDELRPWILRSDYIDDPPDTPLPLTKDLWDAWWKALKMKREFLGLDAPTKLDVRGLYRSGETRYPRSASRISAPGLCCRRQQRKSTGRDIRPGHSRRSDRLETRAQRRSLPEYPPPS